MLSVLASRLGQAVLVMLAVTAVAFLMFRYVGDPVAIMSREGATWRKSRSCAAPSASTGPSSYSMANSSGGSPPAISASATGTSGLSTELLAERLAGDLGTRPRRDDPVAGGRHSGRRSLRPESEWPALAPRPDSRWSASRRRHSSRGSCSSSSSPSRCGCYPPSGVATSSGSAGGPRAF